MKYVARVKDEEYVVEIDHDNLIVVNGDSFRINFQQVPGSGVTSLLLNNRSLEAVVEARDGYWEVLINGELYAVEVEDERAIRLAQARGVVAPDDGEATVRSPMPGIIIDVYVSEGDRVAKGDRVAILESMKMENELRAPRDGLITQVKVGPGASVEKHQIIVVISEQS